ncbi:MAG: hypothetical protein HQ567_20815 [Candidatus Nealsonbacteria bacterium]|nr:hypothetical protein [Candidatus Nealsonbacteria bacterium]
MTRTFTHFSILLLTSAALAALGCNDTQTADTPSSDNADHDDSDQAAAGGHGHDVGPNGGPLAILGSHEFHVELLADEDTGKVRALLTDAEFKPVETAAKSLSINMVLGGEATQFTLDYTDNTSPVEFQTTDKALAVAIHDGWEGEARVVIEIAGSPRTGALAATKGGHKDEHEGEPEGHADHND